MQVVNQLIKHDKNFDLLGIPGANHTSGGPYGDHKRWDFFVQHLLGLTPPRWTSSMKAAETQSAVQADDDENDPLKSPWVTEGGGQ
jgi:heme oxygenase